MKSSAKMYLSFFILFEIGLYVIFKIMHTLFPTTLIFDQIFFISCLNVLLFLAIIRKTAKLNFDKIVAIISLGLCLMFLNQMFILNIDRSRSTYVLSWVDKGHISIDVSGNIVTNGISSNENLNELATIQRVNENITRGLISVGEDKLHLTMTGKFLLSICEGTAVLFDLEGWKSNRN